MKPTNKLRWIIRRNPSPTAREEAVAAEILKQANPRSPISACLPFGPEEQLVLQQLWKSKKQQVWRDVPLALSPDEGSTQFAETPTHDQRPESEVVHSEVSATTPDLYGYPKIPLS